MTVERGNQPDLAGASSPGVEGGVTKFLEEQRANQISGDELLAFQDELAEHDRQLLEHLETLPETRFIRKWKKALKFLLGNSKKPGIK